MIILHSDNNSLLTDYFSLRFDKYDPYDIENDRKVYTVNYSENEWHSRQKPDLRNITGRLIREITESICSESDIDKLRNLTGKLDNCIEQAIEEGDTDIKLRLIGIKECLLDYIINLNKEFEEYFRNQLLEILK